MFNGSTNAAPALTDAQTVDVDFGSAVQASSITRTFIIENTGTSDLTIDSITASGGDFTVSSVIATVAIGAIETFTVTLLGTNTGTFNSIITIVSNDADENPFTFPVTGVITAAPAPEIAVYEGENNTGTGIINEQVAPIDFGSAVAGDNITRSFSVENTGSGVLTITNITATGSDFSISSAITTVAVSETQTFTVTLTGTTPGLFNTVISIISDDADESPFTFELIGQINGINVIDGEDNNGEIIISDQEINVGTTLVNTTIDKVFVIENLSANELIINSITSNNPVFEIIDAPTTIAPGSFDVFTVRLNGEIAGNYTGTLLVSTNLNDFSFIVTGELIEGDLEKLTVYNVVTPNGDGVHDFLKITNIENFSNNQVMIYNRWGDMVFVANGYDNQSIVFNGKASEGSSNELDSGNYYYTILKGNGEEALTGFIFLKR